MGKINAHMFIPYTENEKENKGKKKHIIYNCGRLMDS